MAAPRVSVALPQLLADDHAALAARFAQRAEELGFAGLWTLDSAPGGPTWKAPLLDGLHLLSHAGAVTREIGLGTAVIVLPRRNPILLAKQLASIDQLSGGRLTVGVGLGGDDRGLEGLGLPVGRRVRRFSEAVDAMRGLWAQETADLDGELYRFSGLPLEPKPAQRPGPPLWFGGNAPPALRRAARHADGWIGSGSSSAEDFFVQVATLDTELAAAGRADDPGFAKAKRVYLHVGDDVQLATDELAAVIEPMYGREGMAARCGVCGPVEHCVERLQDLVAAGAQELLLHPLVDPLGQLEAAAEVAGVLRGRTEV
jgi:probable F420-dependent oxidoreductase